MTASGQFGLTAWSGALAGLGYTVFALRLVQMGYLHRPRDWSRLALLTAVGLTALWGWLEVAWVLTELAVFPMFGVLSDQLRYASWFGFLLMLLHVNHFRQGTASSRWLIFWALALAALGPLALGLSLFGVAVFGEPVRLVLFSAMAMPVFALVLLEQVFRNATEDSRWGIKPLCLGLAGIYLFDLYLFSQAVLFNRPDEDALSIRGAVHALMVPLLLLSSTRRSDWISMIRLSPKAAFHSATLLMAGLVPDLHFGRWLLRALFWRRMGARTATGPDRAGPHRAHDSGLVRHHARQVADFPGQTFFSLPV